MESTVFSARKLLLPASVRLTPQGAGLLAAGRSGVQSRDGTVKPLPMATLIDGPVELLDYLDAQWSCLLVGGALTNELARLLAAAAQRIPGWKSSSGTAPGFLQISGSGRNWKGTGCRLRRRLPSTYWGSALIRWGNTGEGFPGRHWWRPLPKCSPGCWSSTLWREVKT